MTGEQYLAIVACVAFALALTCFGALYDLHRLVSRLQIRVRDMERYLQDQYDPDDPDPGEAIGAEERGPLPENVVVLKKDRVA